MLLRGTGETLGSEETGIARIFKPSNLLRDPSKLDMAACSRPAVGADMAARGLQLDAGRLQQGAKWITDSAELVRLAERRLEDIARCRPGTCDLDTDIDACTCALRVLPTSACRGVGEESSPVLRVLTNPDLASGT